MHQDGPVRYHRCGDQDDYPHGIYCRLHDGFPSLPRDYYSPTYDYGYYHYEGRPSEEIEENWREYYGLHHFDRPGREGQPTENQGTEGPEIATDDNHPKWLSLPQPSLIDIASASLPPRGEPEAPGTSSNSNASPGISSLFSELGSRGDSAVLQDFPQLEAYESRDIALPVPGSMGLGSISTREAKGNEANEVAIEDHRTNPVEK